MSADMYQLGFHVLFPLFIPIFVLSYFSNFPFHVDSTRSTE
jgi:hypothetical protein